VQAFAHVMYPEYSTELASGAWVKFLNKKSGEAISPQFRT